MLFHEMVKPIYPVKCEYIDRKEKNEDHKKPYHEETFIVGKWGCE
jgi:hypothetical protein